jgi:hypothetical protein
VSWHALPVAAVGDVLTQKFWDPITDDLQVVGSMPTGSVLSSNTVVNTILSGANRAIKFDTVDQDPTGQSLFDSANYQFVCRTAGWYLGRLMVGWPNSTAGGTIQHGWERNGVQITQGNRQNLSNRQQSWPCMVFTFLSVDDTLRPFAWWDPATHSVGVGMNLTNQSEVPNCSIRMVSL